MRSLLLLLLAPAFSGFAAEGPALGELRAAAAGGTATVFDGNSRKADIGPVVAVPKTRFPTVAKVNKAFKKVDPIQAATVVGMVAGGIKYGALGTLAGMIYGIFGGLAFGLLVMGVAALIDLARGR